MKKKLFDTILAQAGHYLDTTTGGVTPPIHLSTTFARDENYELFNKYAYNRYRNPTYDQVEQLITKLEGGVESQLFSSGMAGLTAVFETITTGESIIAPKVMYHGALFWLQQFSKKRNIELIFFDATDPNALKASIKKNTAIVWIESPVNPTWDIIDIEAAARIAHEAGAILGVDSTVATPITTRPLELGADLVFHSATKYLNGHSDVLAGVVVTKELNDRWDEIKSIRTYGGSVLGSFEAWLLLRGLRTLGVRFERASSNALTLASFFEDHPKIEKVLYPGLESHPGHEVAKKQMVNGFGGMVSLLIKGGEKETTQVAVNLKQFIAATSMGGVESLVEHRALIEGPESSVPKNLLRLSVGIENVDDLIEDLSQALEST